jgi:two-component system cell cycle sensor histidine kinase/response regulator CckA
MDKPIRVLIAEDSENDALLIVRALKRAGYDPIFERIESPHSMKTALTEQTWDLVLSDHTMPQFDSIAALRVLQESGLDIPFIIVSGKIGEEMAVAAMKAGASDYILKDNLARLVPAIERELREVKVRWERRRAEEALRRSEQKFKELSELLPQTVFEIDEKGRLTFANRYAFEIFGYTEDDFGKGLSVLQMIAPEDREKARKNIERILRGEKTDENEYALQRKDGSTFFGIISSSSVAGEKGVTGLRGVITDITNRKKYEEALKESERKFQRLFDEAPVGYHEFDSQGRITRVNKTELELLGFTIDEMLGQPVWKFIAEEEIASQAALDKLTGIMPPGKGFERSYRRKDGTTFPALIEDRLFRDPEGRITGIRSTIQDITERKRTEDALRESEETLRVFLNANLDTALLIDAQGTVLIGNESLSKKLGKHSKEIIGSCLYHLLPEAIGRQRKSYFDEVIRTGEPVCFEDTRLGRDFETFAYPVFDREGTVIKVAILGFDITGRKQTEEQMAMLQEQFRQAQKMEAIGRLAGGIAHDFNNLLTVITGYSQISLQDLKQEDPLRGNIEEIRDAAKLAATLTRQLLAFSRRQVMEMKVIDINRLLKDTEKMLDRILGEDVELISFLAEDLGMVKTDSGQIEQVIMNLAVNARDAMPNGGKLTIETANVELDEAYTRAHVAVTPGHYVMLSVSDTGAGMTPEIRDRVFEPFFTTKGMGKGTGLGLSTVYGIVKQSGGNIWVYSEPGQGSAFKIYLPKVAASPENPDEKVVEGNLPIGSETILVVEDEREVLKLAVRILRKQGYVVLEAGQGDEAFLVCKQHQGPIHLMVTDVVMPGMGGHELAKRMEPLYPNMRVLYMSGYTDNAIVHHGILDEGMNYLQKPFSVEGLARKVREVIDK